MNLIMKTVIVNIVSIFNIVVELEAKNSVQSLSLAIVGVGETLEIEHIQAPRTKILAEALAGFGRCNAVANSCSAAPDTRCNFWQP